MGHRPTSLLPLIIACLFLLAGVSFFAQTAGGNRGTPGRPPTAGSDVGLPGSKQPTTRPGSHESSAKDERDRVAGKFPPPKEKASSEEARRNAATAGTVYVDAIALEGGVQAGGQRQAPGLTADDFRVTIDGGPRRVVSAHYVFRGPQALDAARTIEVGRGVLAHADEARTIAFVVDETSFRADAERSVRGHLEHLLDVVSPVDRVAFLTLPQPGRLTFAGAHADLLRAVAGVVARGPSVAGPGDAPLGGLARVLTELLKIPGPKTAILFSAALPGTTRPVSDTADIESMRITAILDAAAASRTVIDVVTPAHPAGPVAELRRLARSSGGTTVQLTGEEDDLAPLAATLLGGYVIEVEGRTSDRDGASHALTVTTAARGVRILAPQRWMPRFDPLPAPVAKATP